MGASGSFNLIPCTVYLIPFFVCRSRTDDRCSALLAEGRKVRAPQDMVLDNAQSRRREGKCHRKETALPDTHSIRQGKGERVR